MDNNKASVYLSELINDLNEKIKALELAASGANDSVKEKAAHIKNKAVSVLNNAEDKIIELSETITDGEELESAIDLIRKKSDNLFDEAVIKINELDREETDSEGEQTQDDIVELIKDDKEEFEEYKPQKRVTAEEDDIPVGDREVKAEPVRSEVTQKTLEVLKNWLAPGEVYK